MQVSMYMYTYVLVRTQWRLNANHIKAKMAKLDNKTKYGCIWPCYVDANCR